MAFAVFVALLQRETMGLAPMEFPRDDASLMETYKHLQALTRSVGVRNRRTFVFARVSFLENTLRVRCLPHTYWLTIIANSLQTPRMPVDT